ncbi:dihydrolipoyl dehydrogenase [Aureococcus anophagefferens]|nr:dihydrolipoyl dehydrogenase [Aureococcus anophagefferens]
MLAASGRRLAASHRFAATRALSAAGEQYDVVVIGGGPGGYVAAIKASQLGLKTACVESRGTLGGTCLNVGCIPSKALLHSSHLYEEATSHFKVHGIDCGDVTVDLDQMMANKSKSVDSLTGGIELVSGPRTGVSTRVFLFKKYKVDYLQGHGTITGPNSVAVALNDGGSEAVESKNILIATGSEPSPLPPCPVDNAGGKIVDSTGALVLDKIPETMAVVGGGVIGLEMGSVWRRLGTKVTVVEYLGNIVPGVDKEVGKAFLRVLKKQGMKFKLNTGVVASKVVDSGVELTHAPAKDPSKETTDHFDVVLVATGRRPFTDKLGLDALGIETDKLGRVVVDEHFKTKIPSIYAFGDVVDGPMLAHKAEEEGIACVESIAGFAGHVNYDVIPGATDRILGVHIIGPNAGEMIAEGVLGMEYGASSEDIARTCHAHPTLSEAMKEACMAASSQPIHF